MIVWTGAHPGPERGQDRCVGRTSLAVLASGQVNFVDFYPGMGEFETRVFEIPFTLGKNHFQLRCGVLPDLLEIT